MAEKEQNDQTDFLVEKIKARPINRKKLLRRTIITAFMAVLFGLIACVTFLVLEPRINNWLYPEEKPEIVVFPEDQEEIPPEDMLAENQPEETPSPTRKPAEESRDLTEQIERVLSSMVLDKESYREIYDSMSEYVAEVNRYLVMVTAVSSDTDWFESIQESSNQTSGLIITDNGKELFILTDAAMLQAAADLIITFYDGTQMEAEFKQADGSTGLAVLSLDLADLPENLKGDDAYPQLGSSNSSRLMGTPVIAVGRPMGSNNSIGYGMITAANEVYSVADRNYKILQTDIVGSKNASGVLFDLRGSVLGIITGNKTEAEPENVIYAYGITDLRRIMEKMSNGYPVAYLGITGVNVSTEANKSLGMPFGGFVVKVDMNSPAMNAGIQPGDVITGIGDRSIIGFGEYTSVLMQTEPGQVIKITVMRQSQGEYKEMEFQIEVGEVKQ